MTSLNPLMRIGDQITEAMTAHGVARDEARRRTLEPAGAGGAAGPSPDRAGVPPRVLGGHAPARRHRDGPRHAAPVAHRGRAHDRARRDHPAPDPGRRQPASARPGHGHHLGDPRPGRGGAAGGTGRGHVRRLVVEEAPVDQLFHAPQHPYTSRLLASLPDPADDTRPPLAQIPGRPPVATEHIDGCPFRPRCAQARDICAIRPTPRAAARGSGRLLGAGRGVDVRDPGGHRPGQAIPGPWHRPDR